MELIFILRFVEVRRIESKASTQLRAVCLTAASHIKTYVAIPTRKMGQFVFVFIVSIYLAACGPSSSISFETAAAATETQLREKFGTSTSLNEVSTGMKNLGYSCTIDTAVSPLISPENSMFACYGQTKQIHSGSKTLVFLEVNRKEIVVQIWRAQQSRVSSEK